MCAKIKRILASDRDDVLEISRHIWEGHDYLPSVINDWLRDKNSYTYGVEIDNHFVAVANLRIIENGRTGWMEGLRVHPDHRGKGFANALTEHIIQKAEELDISQLRYTTSTENQVSLKLAEKYGFAKVLEMGVFWHPSPETVPSAEEYPHVRKSNSNEVHILLKGNPHIVPHRVLIYDWKALDVTLKGLETLGKVHEFYVALRDGKLDSFSYGYPVHRSELLMWAFTIYSTDQEGFLSHLSYNINLVLERGVTAVMGTYELSFEETLHDVDWISKERWGTHLVLLERIMR